MSSDCYECETLNVNCYNNLLEHTFKLPRLDCNFKKTVKDVSLEYGNNKLIIRIKEHLTSSLYGFIFDIWDCSNELVDCFWIVQ